MTQDPTRTPGDDTIAFDLGADLVITTPVYGEGDPVTTPAVTMMDGYPVVAEIDFGGGLVFQVENLGTTIMAEPIARICHEVNRIWCQFTGDLSQVGWDEAEDWQRQSAIDGVQFMIDNPDASDSALHDNWAADKRADGWVYGPEKDAEAKTHPCLVDFQELPPNQQFKDRLFRTIVRAAVEAVG